ncbi:MAG: AAA family ATPase [Deltaproteobacteria bacterium]|nr:AAA family ATPase [Deltaproteobacteria bacterium]MBN2686553.1 AAA family ATPase [Deltaproteobacteria bacterium]
MDTLIIGSTRKNAGKTGVIIGLAQVKGGRFGYVKPLGDRLFYRKKRLWDYDSSLMVNIFNLDRDPEDLSIGFDHAKIRYMYDEQTIRDRLSDLIENSSGGESIVYVEGAQDLTCGASVNLDAVSVARYTGGKLVIVVSGDDDMIMDDLSFVKRHVDLSPVDFRGVIVNKVKDPDDFRNTYSDSIEQMGIDVIGIMPYKRELSYMSVSTLVERIFVKVLAGEGGLGNVIQNIFIGAESGKSADMDPRFKRENKLVITSGDRSDMIVAALESDTACILLSNNIVPSPAIISKASELNVPLLLVPDDTYQVTRQIDSMDIVVAKNETDKINMLKLLVAENLDMEKL